jgi:hypothetical protein
VGVVATALRYVFWSSLEEIRDGGAGDVRYEVRQLPPLTLVGLSAVTAMLISDALEKPSRRFILGLVEACAIGAICGSLQGARPGGPVEGVWSVVAPGRSRVAQPIP